MPTMKALQPHIWQQRTVKRGEEYPATENEAVLVEALGWSKRLPDRIDIINLDSGLGGETLPRPKRQYRRRDMTAEH